MPNDLWFTRSEKFFTLLHLHSAEKKNFDQLIKSLKDCRYYHDKRNAMYILAITSMIFIVVLGINLIPLIFPRNYGLFNALGKTATSVFEIIQLLLMLFIFVGIETFGILLLTPMSLNALGHTKQFSQFIFTHTTAWKAFTQQLSHITKLEDLTKNPQTLTDFGNSLVELQEKYFDTIKDEVHPLMSREALVRRAEKFWKIPRWIFDQPDLQIQAAAYDKVSHQLDQLFLPRQLPSDITYLITDYLLPEFKFQM